MGKHDKTIATSSEEYLQNRIRELEKRLAFAAESNTKLIKENAKYNKWMSEIEATAFDKVAELEAENSMLREKIAKLVEIYV